MITILYFARLREQLQCESESLELTQDIAHIASLANLLRSRGGVWEEAFGGSTLMSAINQEVANPTSSIKDGDEIAFFPPVTGG